MGTLVGGEQRDHEGGNERQHDLGEHPRAEPDDDHRCQGDLGQAIEGDHERIDDACHAAREPQQQAADGAQNTPRQEPHHGGIDGGNGIVEQLPGLDQSPGFTGDAHRRAHQEGVDPADVDPDLPQDDDQRQPGATPQVVGQQRIAGQLFVVLLDAAGANHMGMQLCLAHDSPPAI